MRATHVRILVCAVAFTSLLLAAPGYAVPVPCPGFFCSVSDAGTTLESGDGRLFTLRVSGSDQLFQQVFLVTPGVNSAMNPVQPTEIDDVLTQVSATQDEDTNQIVMVFADAALNITVTYTLVGAPRMATVSYLAIVQSLMGDDTNLAIVDYIDFDLMGDSQGDTVSFTPDTITQTGKGATATARSVSSYDFVDVGVCCATAMFSRLVDGHLSGDVGPVGPTDTAGAFQNNITLSSNGAFTIARELQVTLPPVSTIAPAPSLSPIGMAAALIALAGVGLASIRRRVRSA